jgi:type I restriction-modification system DNA methylase subunit
VGLYPEGLIDSIERTLIQCQDAAKNFNPDQFLNTIPRNLGNMFEDIKKTLWATADRLRANMDAAEYKHIVLGLIFVKFISDTFQTHPKALMQRRGRQLPYSRSWWFADGRPTLYFGSHERD